MAACTCTPDGEVFAIYFYFRRRPAVGLMPPPVEDAGTQFENKQVIPFREIVPQKEKVGTVYCNTS